MKRSAAGILAVVTMGCFLTGCSGWKSGLPARGRIGPHAIETRVDTEIARYYLSTYLAGKRLNPEADRRIDRVYTDARPRLPDRRLLKQLTHEFSIDFAALYFADRLSRIPANQHDQIFFEQVMNSTQEAFDTGRLALPPAARRYTVYFVPGYLYRSHRATGADFRIPRETLARLGMAHRFIETDEDGPIEANADRVVATLRNRQATDRRIILVSASKSGPEVALALTRLGPENTRHVAAWINIVGALQGSLLADEHLRHRLKYIVGDVDPAGVQSLATHASRKRFATFRIPESILVINYIGIPLTGSISYRARRGYDTLRQEGPNDGLSLLPDLLLPGAPTLVEMGSDHFLLTERMEVKTVALATALIDWLSRP